MYKQATRTRPRVAIGRYIRRRGQSLATTAREWAKRTIEQCGHVGPPCRMVDGCFSRSEAV